MLSIFLNALALWVLLSAIVRPTRATESHITCANGTENQREFSWWNNKHGENPCQMLQTMLRNCDPDHTIQKMPKSPVHSPDICKPSDSAGADNLFIPCCCSTVAYALREACWSCQQGKVEPPEGHRRPTFKEYLQCQNPFPNYNKLVKSVSAPEWTAMPIGPDGTWNLTKARIFAAQTTMHMMNANPGDSSASNSPSHKTSSSPSITVPEAAIIGVLSGLGTVVLALAIVVFIQRCRRRQKRKVVPDWCQRMQGDWGHCNPPLTQPVSAYPGPCPNANVAAQPYEFAARNAPSTVERPVPPPQRQRSKLQRILGVKSWRSSLAQEPDIRDDISEKDVEFDAAMLGDGTKRLKLTDARASESWTPIAWMTPSMSMSRSVKSFLRPEIASNASTHTFSI